MGVFHDAIAVACLDSRISRLALGRRVWRVGRALIDGAVGADGLMARVATYVPGGACLECSWTEADYDKLEQIHPCQEAQS